jgi:hypothetical protein
VRSVWPRMAGHIFRTREGHSWSFNTAAPDDREPRPHRPAAARGAARPAWDSAHARDDAGGGARAGDARALRRADDLRQPRDDHARPGACAARLRRGRQGRRRDPLRVVHVHRVGALHPAHRRAVPAARHGRVHRGDRGARASRRHRGRHTVRDVGRDLRPHAAQPGEPHGADGARGRGRARAVHVGAHAGQGARVLHRVRTRRADVAPADVPHPDREGHRSGPSARRRAAPGSS